MKNQFILRLRALNTKESTGRRTFVVFITKINLHIYIANYNQDIKVENHDLLTQIHTEEGFSWNICRYAL